MKFSYSYLATQVQTMGAKQKRQDFGMDAWNQEYACSSTTTIPFSPLRGYL